MKSPLKSRRGAALVEFSIVLPLLMLLLLGVMEFGMIMHDFITLAHSVREGVRSAAIGSTADEIRQHVEHVSLPGLQDDMIHIRYEDKNGNWVDVTGASTGAAVPSDAHYAEVSVVGYPHKMVTGSFFAWLPGVQNNTMLLRSKMVMRREYTPEWVLSAGCWRMVFQHSAPGAQHPTRGIPSIARARSRRPRRRA